MVAKVALLKQPIHLTKPVDCDGFNGFMSTNEYQKIQDEILNHLLRGKNTIVLSRKLGYNYNQIQRWLDHSKKLRWSEFVDLCEYLKIDLGHILEQVVGISVLNKADTKKLFVKLLLAEKSSPKQKIKSSTKSRSSIYRRQRALVQPTFLEILDVFDKKSGRLKRFINQLKSFHKESALKSIRSPFSVPWFGVVSAALAHSDHLALPEYSKTWISEKVGLSGKEVQEGIDIMLENELIRWNGKHFEPTQARTIVVNHQRSQEDFDRSLKFWLERCLRRVDRPSKENRSDESFSAVFRTFRSDKKNIETINLWIKELEEKVHNLLAESPEPKDEIRCFIWSHFAVNEK